MWLRWSKKFLAVCLLVISWQLVMGPITELLSVRGIFLPFHPIQSATANEGCEANDPTVKQMRLDCIGSDEAKAGAKEWDWASCSCRNSEEAQEMRDTFGATCGDMEDATEEEKRSCAEAFGREYADDFGFDGESGWGGATQVPLYLKEVVQAFSLAVAIMALVGMIAQQDGSAYDCTSKTLYAATGVIAFLGEFAIYMWVQNELRDLQADYEENWINPSEEAEENGEAPPQSAFDVQIQAFNYMVDEQKAIENIADKKFLLHLVASIAYGVTALVALLEMVVPAMTKCGSVGVPNSGHNKNFNPFDHAKQQLFATNYRNSPGYHDLLTFYPDLSEEDLYDLTLLGYRPPQIASDSGIIKSVFTMMEYRAFLNGQSHYNGLEDWNDYVLVEVMLEEEKDVAPFVNQAIQTAIDTMIPVAVASGDDGKISNADQSNVDDINQANDGSVGKLMDAGNGGEFFSATWKDDNAFFDIYRTVVLGAGVLVGVAATWSDFIKELISSSLSIAIVGAIGLAMHIWLTVVSNEEKNRAIHNQELLEELIAKFRAVMAPTCPHGRDTLDPPDDATEAEKNMHASCYCYNADGTKNNSRSNSETCQGLWNQYSLYAPPTEEEFNTGSHLACYTVTGQFDPKCKCKMFKDSQGKNACMKTSLGMTNVNIGNGISTGMVTGNADKFAQGQFTTGGQASSDLVKSVGRIRRKVMSGIDQANKVLKQQKVKPISKDIASQALKLSKKLNGFKTFSRFKGKMDASPPPAKGGLAKAIKKANDSKKKLVVSGGGGLGKKKKKVAKKKGLGFGFGEENTGGQVLNLGPDKRKYKMNEGINTRKGVSIWKIITNRYNQSGLRRLFAEDGEDVGDEEEL